MGSGRSWRTGEEIMTELETQMDYSLFDHSAMFAAGQALAYVARLTPFEREELCYFIRTNDE